MMNAKLACLTSAALLGAVALYTSPADACGGCFVPGAESTVVTGHRMALSISPVQTVLWDQIQYAGDASDFSWVLPVKPGTVVEQANPAFFEALEAASGVTVRQPPEGCKSTGGSGFGCSADEATFLSAGADGANGGGGVQVVHKGTVGPYETVTLSATDPNALSNWLLENGYALPDDMKPTIAAYVEEGFDFIALKLQPDKGVQQMTPVRVVTEGAGYALPLRMVGAGTGAKVDMVLYLISEGRYQAANFDNAVIPPALISWDFKDDRSDYAQVRLDVLGNNDGATWLTTYSRTGSLLGPVSDPLSFGNMMYRVGDSGFANSIADAYFMQATLNDGEFVDNCIGKTDALANAMDVVTDLCDENGENCEASAGAGQLDSRLLECDDYDDIAVALIGMHPRDVVLTRMEASLPRAALAADLVVEAASEQNEVSSRFVAGLKLNACWDSEPAAILVNGKPTGLPPGGFVMLLIGAAGLMLVMRREQRRAGDGAVGDGAVA